ncbi:hypothetical protein [Methylorubrum sp. SB2]|uniref:hypothetical protein n=1 Tax=Methylorubrum subtropicum TaxID=3138812 RepID=UPI00313EA117
MTAFPRTLLPPNIKASIGRRIAEAQREARRLGYDKILLPAVFLPALTIVCSIDYVLIRQLFIHLLADNPKEAPWAADVLALTTITILIGVHAVTGTARSERFTSSLRRTAQAGLAFVILGLGLMLASVLYRAGASSVMNNSLANAVDAFLGEATTNLPPVYQQIFESKFLPGIPILFVCGMAGLLAVSIYSGHVLVTAIYERGRGLWERGAFAKTLTKQLRVVREYEAKYDAAEQTYRRLRDVDPSALDRRVADDIVAAGLTALRPAEHLLAARELMPNADERLDALLAEYDKMPVVLRSINQGELKQRVEALRAILTRQHVLAAANT